MEFSWLKRMATLVDITSKMELPAAETHSKGHLTASKDTLLFQQSTTTV
jgi:hypothetical protein